MIALTPAEHDALRSLTRAGREGLPIADIGLSVALRLQLAGLASITTTTPQRAIVTGQGAAHSRRGVFA